MHALTGRLARLRVAGNDYLMSKRLHQNLVLMAFLINVAYRVLGNVPAVIKPCLTPVMERYAGVGMTGFLA